MEIPEHPHPNTSLHSYNTHNIPKIEEAAQSSIINALTVEFSFKYCPGVVGVPITFLDSYSIEQFAIVGYGSGSFGLSIGVTGYKDKYKPLLGNTAPVAGNLYYVINGQPVTPYKRILIQRKV